MSENELVETQPTPVKSRPSSEKKKKFPTWLALLVFIVLLAVGILGGYGSGMGKRYSAENTQVTGQLQEQYQLGMQAMDAGQYSVAKQHFEFIIQHDPEFPGVQNAYAILLLRMAITPTPVPSSTPTITATPDLRGVDAIYNDITALLSASGQNLCGRNWDDIIAKLDSLRKTDASYHTAEVDGMYYIALRSRGVCKIYPQTFEPDATCQELNINLEGGIFDLTLAERFGPLDTDAAALRTWARMYIAGASFWDQDWVQVKNYFSQVMANVPYLSDSTCTSAIERWRLASIGYAQYLINKGDFCHAEDQFRDAFSIQSPKNNAFFPTATEVRRQCNGGSNAATEPPVQAPEITPTPEATAAPPAETPTT